MNNQIGLCSECGGRVIVPSHSVWPTPHCMDCGAVATIGPKIQMKPGSGHKGVQYPSPMDDERPERTRG